MATISKGAGKYKVFINLDKLKLLTLLTREDNIGCKRSGLP
jgi:hypothetical protein